MFLPKIKKGKKFISMIDKGENLLNLSTILIIPAIKLYRELMILEIIEQPIQTTTRLY